MVNRVVLGNKVLEVPIIQGGMGVGVSLGGLAGAVMKEGAMGVISAAHPGYRKQDFYTNTIQCNCDAIKEEIAKAKDIAQGKGLCGVNVMVASKHYEEYVKAVIEGGADAIISGAGLPMHLPAIEGSEKILLAPIVSSGRAASLILKTWDRHHQRCADFIVIESSLAGGHLGFKKEDLLNDNVQSLEEILSDVITVVKTYEEKFERTIPIFVAGGIYDGADIAHFMKLGAQGVQMATRFIATDECDADIAFKQAILDAKQGDVALCKSPAGLPGRAIQNDFVKRTMEGRIVPAHCVQCMHPCVPATTPYCITDVLIHAVQGNLAQGLVFAGANAYRIDKIISVKELISALMTPLREEN